MKKEKTFKIVKDTFHMKKKKHYDATTKHTGLLQLLSTNWAQMPLDKHFVEV